MTAGDASPPSPPPGRPSPASGPIRVFLVDDHRLFLYLPFEHAESQAAQLLSVALFASMTDKAEWLRYAERHADPDGRIRATFAIVYLSGWAPHESQPKPLRPGSATVRLADALKGSKA